MIREGGKAKRLRGEKRGGTEREEAVAEQKSKLEFDKCRREGIVGGKGGGSRGNISARFYAKRACTGVS